MAGKVPASAMLAKIGLDKSPTYVVSQMPPTDEEIAELGLGRGDPRQDRQRSARHVCTAGRNPARDPSGVDDQAVSCRAMLPCCPRVFDEANFAFYGKTPARHPPEQRPRWKAAPSAKPKACSAS